MAKIYDFHTGKLLADLSTGEEIAKELNKPSANAEKTVWQIIADFWKGKVA